MLLAIQHELHLTYSAAVSESAMEVRLMPRSDSHQTLRSFDLIVGPDAPVFVQTDLQGNRVHYFSIFNPHERNLIFAESMVETHPIAQAIEDLSGDLHMPLLDSRSHEYLAPHGPAQFFPYLEQFVKTSGFFDDSRIAKVLSAALASLPALMRFKRAATSEGLGRRFEGPSSGLNAARDQANLALSLLRLLGIPARYVSGYLVQLETSTAACHAWIEAYLPKHGWCGLDTLSGRPIGEGHVAVASGRSSLEVPTQMGTFRGRARQISTAKIKFEFVRAPLASEWLQQRRIDARYYIDAQLRSRNALGDASAHAEEC
ncbi:MAG TPA: transglutaminase family protein [Polyangiaceae bacterium]